MDSIKNIIPDETVLRARIAESWGDFDDEIQREVGPLEKEYRKVRDRQRIGGALFVAVAVLFGVVDVFEDLDFAAFIGDVIALVLTILFFPVIIILVVAGFKLMRDKNGVVRRFNQGINALLFPKVLSVFGLTGSHMVAQALSGTALKNVETEMNKPFWKRDLTKGLQSSVLRSEHKQVMDLLDHSELVTEPRNTVVVDDMMHIPWNNETGSTLFISELDLKHTTGSGKNRRVKNIFSGYFVSFDLKRPLEGKTFVSTEGDKKGFGHQSFWKHISGNDIEVTELEWNDFENLLHVASNNQSEARYVLTTSFMADLYDWWKDKNVNIRISFIGSRMYMLFPDTGVRFKKSVPSLDTKEMQEYAMTVATPLMHVLHLVEDVKN